MKLLIITLCLLTCGTLLAAKCVFGRKTTYQIETSDVGRFWQACDSLQSAHSNADSINIIQQLYLDKLSKSGEKFIAIRKYTAAEYVRAIRRYPLYLKQLRKKTALLAVYKADIDTAFNKLKAAIPGYQVPDVCFAIGCFRGGGTTKKDLILIGTEIALADSTMDCSEFKGWLHTVLSTADGHITNLIAHESIHCQQKHGQNNSLLSLALHEGAADFLPALILHSGINQVTDAYGTAHECELWKEFEAQMNGDDISQWLFNSSESKNRPADLGYFMGMRICEAYYNKQADKKQAIADLLDRSKYLQVMQQSGYRGNCK